MSTTDRRVGRPAGREYTEAVKVRLRPADRAELRELARLLEVGEAEAVRRAIELALRFHEDAAAGFTPGLAGAAAGDLGGAER